MKIGDVFGKLKVVSEKFKPNPDKYDYFVRCECSCGSGVREYRAVSLTKKKNPTKSCGCLQRESARDKKKPVGIGEVFNKLTVLEDMGNAQKHRMVLVSCACGADPFQARYESVKNGHTSSCGCLQKAAAKTLKFKHGMSHAPEYDSWQAMKERCRNPKTPGFENYGGRGISYDPRWEDFRAFYADMGERPEGTSLDRIDVNADYHKDNCRWATVGIQNFNRRKKQGCTSEYVGVYYDQARDAWVARLNKDGIVVLQKRFLTEEAAARAYDEACFEHYGVRKNFPDQSNN